ncbi:MAG: YqeG family HAD IIIA-type phosphatase [Firmicutes bacterium]|nr:YqeG family HAD IIIA-type phosphatase [Bacillota bacterium]
MIDLKPDYFVDTIYDIDLTVLKKNEINTILIDIDNTIVPFKTMEPDDKVLAWIKLLKNEGFKLCLVSNAYPRRAQIIAGRLDIPVIYMAKKPFKKGVVDSLKLIKSKNYESILVGDQIFTDIFAARLAGVKSILVEPMTTSDFFMTKIYRVFEFFVKRHLIKEKMK